MEAVIKQLRASKQRQLEELTQEGLIFGKAWAERTAEYFDLQVLECSSPGQEDFYDERFLTNLLEVDHDNFWEEVLHDGWQKRLCPELQYGFVQGALQIWYQVVHKL